MNWGCLNGGGAVDRPRPADVPADDNVGPASDVDVLPTRSAIGSGSRARLVGCTLDLSSELVHVALESVVSSHLFHLLQGI